MKELFTEKDYTEAVQKLNEKIINDFYNNLSNYSPFDNYVNLNNYEIPKEEFKLLWRCQELLHYYDLNRQLLSHNCISIFDSLKKRYIYSLS